jgi:biotin transporter BioY
MIVLKITAGIVAYYLCGWLSLVVSYRLKLFSYSNASEEIYQILATVLWPIWGSLWCLAWIFVKFFESAKRVGKGKK